MIRDAGPGDLAAIHAIYAVEVRLGTASWELEPPDLAEMTRRFQAIGAGGYPWLVLEREGRIAGYAYASAFRPRPGYRFTCENSVYVADWARGQKVGRRLLEALIVRCTDQGLRQMLAVIGDSANHASIGLHHACGFVHAGLFPAIGWKHGRWLDGVWMQRALGPGAATPPAASAACP